MCWKGNVDEIGSDAAMNTGISKFLGFVLPHAVRRPVQAPNMKGERQ